MALKKKKSKVTKAAKRKVVKKTVKRAKKKLIKRRPVIKQKSAAKKAKKVVKKVKKEANLIGTVTHYFPHVQAAVIKLTAPLAIGDTVKIKGHTTDLAQMVTSMQIDRVNITSAKKGDEIGVQVSTRVRQTDKVYKG